MNAMALVQDAGVWALLQLTLLPVALLVCLITGVALLLNRRVPPDLPVAALALAPLLAVIGGTAAAVRVAEASAHAAPEMKMTLVASGITMALGVNSLAMWVVLGPSLLLLVLCAAAGAMRGSRRSALPAAAVGLAVVMAIAGLLSGLAAQGVVTGTGRAGLYLVAGLLAAVALVGRDPETSAPFAGATAALALPVLVGCVEAWAIAAGEMAVFQAVAHVSAESKASLLVDGIGIANAGRVWSWIALGAASAVAGLGVAGAMQGRPGWNPGVLLGLLGIPAVALLLWSSAGPLLTRLTMEWS